MTCDQMKIIWVYNKIIRSYLKINSFHRFNFSFKFYIIITKWVLITKVW